MTINCPNCGHTLFVTSDPVQSAAGAPAAAPSPSAPARCKHGDMFYKAGKNKQGKDYAGYFCSADECKPVWV